ncbi:MAG: hypothetical protein RL490_720 [Pseudomonadota bacterium]
MTHVACPVCAAPARAWRQKTVDGATWAIDRCGTCGHGFVTPRPSLDFLLEYYEGTASLAGQPLTLADVLAAERASPNSVPDAAAMLDRIAGLSPPRPDSRLLDVGSGYGFFSAAAQARGYQIAAIELGSVQRDISAAMTGVAPVAVPYEDYAPAGPGFDVVLMSQILEHALDIDVWMEKSRALLVDGGVLAIALPNFASLARRLLQEREPFICPPEHLNFFTPDSLSHLLRRHGFDIAATEWVTRLPRAALARRLPGALQPLLPAVNAGTRLASGLVDALRLGSVLRIYARKRSPAGRVSVS